MSIPPKLTYQAQFQVIDRPGFSLYSVSRKLMFDSKKEMFFFFIADSIKAGGSS